MSHQTTITAGQPFGRLTVIRENEERGPNGQRRVDCKCTCGELVTVRIARLMVKYSPTRSCGCLSRDLARIRATVHGLRHMPEYRAWLAMNRRCANPIGATILQLSCSTSGLDHRRITVSIDSRIRTAITSRAMSDGPPQDSSVTTEANKEHR